jgi:putative intracellular protease/amidase
MGKKHFNKSNNMKSIKVLFVTTSHDKMGDTNAKTGVWLEELSAPYYVFKEVGADITVASPKGGQVPLDPKSLAILVSTRTTKRFLKDEEAMNFLSHSTVLSEIKADDFDVVFLPGGHGPLWDLADNLLLKQLLEAFNRDDKPIGAVCHGVAGLVTLQNEEGAFLVKGKQLTGFSNSEEESSGLTKVVPFLLETKLLSLGALYSKGANYVSYVVAAGNIITGQNPASSEEVAKKMVALVKNHAEATTAF